MKLPRPFYFLNLCAIIIIACSILILPPGIPNGSAMAARRAIRAVNASVATTPPATMIAHNSIKDIAQRLMNNVQNWFAAKANAIISDAKTAVKNEIKRRVDRQIKDIETPIDRAVKTIKETISAKYNQAIDAIKKTREKALPKLDN